MVQNNEELEARKRSIRERLGKEAEDALRELGINLDDALTRVLGKQMQEEEARALERSIPITSNMMTSELVYCSASPEDLFGRAYVARLKSIDFDDAQIKVFYQGDVSILARGRDKFGRAEPWAGRYFFRQGTKKEDLPSSDELTLSELVLITDDATAAFTRDHHWLSPETWNAVCEAALQMAESGGTKYTFALRARVQALGWSREQEDAYTRNESMLTERLKWGYHDRPAWTQETTRLELYKR